MTDYQKKEIKMLLEQHIRKYKSQRAAVEQGLVNVSESIVIQIMKGRWEKISDAMWISIGKQVGFTSDGKWNLAQTRPFNALVKLLTTAQDNAMTQAIAIPAGRGKTFTLNYYRQHKPNVFHIVCAQYMSNKELLSRILRKMGKEPIGSATTMMDTIIETVLKMDAPMIILDEFDKLKDTQKLFFITLYNMLEDHCALALVGTHNLEYQIKKRTGKHALGFEEILSRVNRKFITLPDCSLKDITEICEANGLYDPGKISSIYNECEGDLRRVRTAVRIARMQQKNGTHLIPA
jgi:hypothetical protein